MAQFYYKTEGEVSEEYNITLPVIEDNVVIDTVTVNLIPITDGGYTHKCIATCDSQVNLDVFEANISAAEGVIILTQIQYDALS